MLSAMENTSDPHQALRAADRAEAAPYLDWRAPPWVPLTVGLIAAVFVLGVHLGNRADVPGWLSALPLLLVVAMSWGIGTAVYRAHGAWPTAQVPREVTRVFAWYVLGAGLVAVLLFLLGDHAPLWLGVLGGLVLGCGGMVLFGRAYERALRRLERRLS